MSSDRQIEIRSANMAVERVEARRTDAMLADLRWNNRSRAIKYDDCQIKPILTVK